MSGSSEYSVIDLQKVLIEMLQMFDSFCRGHNIIYSLYAGTALGAVRHQDMIPWDDDIDVCMSYSEYSKFVAAWEKEHPDGYTLQTPDNTKYYPQLFSKIRKDHTTFLEFEHQRGLYHTGVFIDIFVIYKMPEKGIKKTVFDLSADTYLLLGKTHDKASFRGKFAHFVDWVLPTKIKRIIIKKAKAVLSKDYIVYDEVDIYGKKVRERKLPAGFSESVVDTPFRNITVMISVYIRDLLLLQYGDYMQLPPESERTWKHHPLILDFEHSLEELEQGND